MKSNFGGWGIEGKIKEVCMVKSEDVVLWSFVWKLVGVIQELCCSKEGGRLSIRVMLFFAGGKRSWLLRNKEI